MEGAAFLVAIQANLRAQKVLFFSVWQVSLTEDYDILQVVGEGWFAKILLAEHRVSGTEIVLKALPKVLNSAADFYREFHYSIHLSVHRNIITSVDVAFETPGFYVFAQVCFLPLSFFYLTIL
jgi:serine/threonine-protein kinase SBK